MPFFVSKFPYPLNTEQLEKQYGYNHPPRAARDVRESGIPLETFRVKDSEGRSIAAYRFGDLNKVRKGRLEGRQTFSKKFRDKLYDQSGGKCSICSGNLSNVIYRLTIEFHMKLQGIWKAA
jgi:hypothetical protein